MLIDLNYADGLNFFFLILNGNFWTNIILIQEYQVNVLYMYMYRKIMLPGSTWTLIPDFQEYKDIYTHVF